MLNSRYIAEVPGSFALAFAGSVWIYGHWKSVWVYFATLLSDMFLAISTCRQQSDEFCSKPQKTGV